MSFVLEAWFGVVTSLPKEHKEYKRVVQVYAKLGGAHLGTMVLPTKVCIKTCFYAIRELQRQGAKLLPHHERPREYLSVVLDGRCLPSFTYTNYAWHSASLRVLQRATSASRLELSWNDDDSEVLKAINAGQHGSHLNIEVDGSYDPEYLKVLAFHFSPKAVRVHQTDLNPIDLEFLSQFRALHSLFLVRVLVKSWCWLRKVGVPSLVLNLYNIKMPSSAFVGIRVKRLSIVSNRYVHTPLSIIEGLGLASFDISVHNVAPNEVDNYKALSNLTCKDVVICITTTNSQSLQRWESRWESHTKKWETLMN